MNVRVGLTLPSFVDDPEIPIAVARAAEAAELDAVWAASEGDYPVWVGGRTPQVREIVALADGWNQWGGSPEALAAEVELVREVAPDATITWGGLTLTGADDAAALAKAEARSVG